MNSYIGVEMFINNEKVTKVGYLLSEYISPVVFNDALNPNPNGTLNMPCEVYVSDDNRYTFILMRSGVCQGKMYPFG